MAQKMQSTTYRNKVQLLKIEVAQIMLLFVEILMNYLLLGKSWVPKQKQIYSLQPLQFRICGTCCSVIQTADVTGHNTDDISKNSQIERF